MPSIRQIASLPFEGRDPVAILSLQPGVVTVADRGQVDLSQDSRGGAVNGARSDQTNVTLDGVDNNDQLEGFAFTGALRATLDSIEEFRVTTSNAGADQGRSSGAQVALLTKSGTNDFHGTAYEYYRPKNLWRMIISISTSYNRTEQAPSLLQSRRLSSSPDDQCHSEKGAAYTASVGGKYSRSGTLEYRISELGRLRLRWLRSMIGLPDIARYRDRAESLN
jgi:hypothetical protein